MEELEEGVVYEVNSDGLNLLSLIIQYKCYCLSGFHWTSYQLRRTVFYLI